MSSAHAAVHPIYEERIAQYDQRLEAIERQSSQLTWLRVGSFIAAVVLGSFAWANPPLFWMWLTFAAVMLAVFVVFVRRFDGLQLEAGEIRHRRAMNRVQIARLDRNWREIPEIKVNVAPQHSAVVRDLDLVGPTSVFQLICLAHTPIGRATLLDWLLSPALPDEVQIRQEAVRALAPEVQLREEFD
ncbi:MAG: hypothetical protein KDB01_27910, partial [Planctomycetaceae bacterium]|nr:hypothetical protein [Planctomycetaceae bacterium]